MCRCGIKLEVRDTEATCQACSASYTMHVGALSPA
jgi:hypothetical protein